MDLTDRLPVTLNLAEWNQVITLLVEGPYRIVAPLIQALHQQLNPPRQDNVVSMGENA